MKTQDYQVAVVLTINTTSYDDALDWAAAIVKDTQAFEDTGVKVELITDYERDNDGQRVLYLDPADEDVEPPEPDGEAFRGGEYAAYMAEEQARIQRELK